jgi:hypothetical protein
VSSTERSAALLMALFAMATTARGALAGVPDARSIVDDPAYQRDHPADSPQGPSVCPLNSDGAPSSCSGGDDAASAGTKPGDSRKPGQGTKPGDGSSKAGNGATQPGGDGDTKPGGNGDAKPDGNGDAKPDGNGDTKAGGDGDTKPGSDGGATPGGSAQSGDGAQPGGLDGGAGARPGTAGPREPSAGREPRTPPTSKPDDLPAASETPDILGRVLMVMLGAGLVALLVMGGAWLFSRRRPPPVAAPPELDAAPAAARPVDPAQAETMAHEGRYADAVRVLLHASLARLAAVGRSVVATDTTSREALARAALDDSARSALYELVLAVEASLFGGAAIGRDDYVRCSASYHRLVDALGAQRDDALGAPPGARVRAHE